MFQDTGALVAPVRELYNAFAVVKKKWLKGRKYWYLNLIARHPERYDRGEPVLLTHPSAPKLSALDQERRQKMTLL